MKISLIITSFNSEKYLEKAIISFLCQDYQDKELIIFDGKSSDESHDIIKKYQKTHSELIKWINEADSGISQARNKALNYVTGDLVGFLGADDILHRDFYKKMAYYTEINPDFDVIYFNNYAIGNTNSFTASSQVSITTRALIKHCPIGSGESFYYKRDIFDKVKFNESNLYSMDYELNMQLSASCKDNGEKYSFFPVNIDAVFNGSFGDSISSSNSLKQRLESIAVQLKYCKNFREKLHLIFRRKKIILQNISDFLQIKNRL